MGHSVWSGVDAEEKQTAWFGARFFFCVFILGCFNFFNSSKTSTFPTREKNKTSPENSQENLRFGVCI